MNAVHKFFRSKRACWFSLPLALVMATLIIVMPCVSHAAPPVGRQETRDGRRERTRRAPGIARSQNLKSKIQNRVAPPPAEWKWQLGPRRVALPPVVPGSGVTNPIDRLLSPYFRAHQIKSGGVVPDRVYARRIYLDIIGLLPSPDQLRAFEQDIRPDKRARLARTLLDDTQNYAVHWLTFWNDMLRNDYAGTGYIDGGRTQITDWLYSALASNLPYNQFVSQLVNPMPESAGFVKGIVWRGVVNASQTPEMQAAQNISQVFLGINLKCASCHNSFTSQWKLADAYGMASVYAAHPLELVRCDKPQGQTASASFLYPQLGKVDANAPREKRLAQLADALTNKSNGRLARTLVNRYWAKLMGRGLIEPTDEMDRRPWSPDLLDWLAGDFADNGYDIKRLIYEIVTSQAYQRPTMSLKSEQASDFVFSGPTVKRMSAEQFTDAVSKLTGVWPRPARDLAFPDGQPVVPFGAKLVYSGKLMRNGAAEIDADVSGAQVLRLIVTDGGDGGAFDWADWGEARIVGPNGETPLNALPWVSATTGYGQIQRDQSVVEKPLRINGQVFAHGIGTHANSVITLLLPPGTTRFRALAGPDTGATEQANAPTSIRFFVLVGDRSLLSTRAALALADPLMRALGRPNREQVVTERGTSATTLQALELTNGTTLTDRIAQGAQTWASDQSKLATPGELINAIYTQALGRGPSLAERQAALNLLTPAMSKDSVEDLLWALVMLPEFQLIY